VNKEIIIGSEVRRRILEGVSKAAEAVSVTLGPGGRNVVLEHVYSSPTITKDGVTVAREIQFKDHILNMGAALIKEVASKTNDIAGDGTTTATLLTHHIFKEGLRYAETQANVTEIKRGIDRATGIVVSQLEKMSLPVTGPKDIERIANIASNYDSEISQIITEALGQVGNDGILLVEESNKEETEFKKTEGMDFDSGYLSPYLITDPERMICEFGDGPNILLVDKRLESVQQILPILEISQQTHRALVIICEGAEEQALATLVVNHVRGNLRVCAIKAPYFGESRSNFLQDIATMTGAKIISDTSGVSFTSFTGDDFGRCNKAVISKNHCSLLEGSGDKEEIAQRKKALQNQLAETESDYEKEKLQERIAKMSSGVAMIRAGGTTETEMREKKMRIEDAIHATRAAVDEGYVPGGGVALLRTIPELDKAITHPISTMTVDERIGMSILKEAITQPTIRIASNAGQKSGEHVAEKIMENPSPRWGYNAKTNTFEDLIAAGVIDPTKVVKSALINAASMAGLLLTTGCVIVEEESPEPNSALGPQGFPGMPG
jgi:chaperonin GroEL